MRHTITYSVQLSLRSRTHYKSGADMLNKKVCRRCYGDLFGVNGVVDYHFFEEYWTDSHAMCIFGGRKIDSMPPKECRYILEQIVTSQEGTHGIN